MMEASPEITAAETEARRVLSTMPGFWLVLRHGGRGSDSWKVRCYGKTEDEARSDFGKTRLAARQGGVALAAPDGTIRGYYSAPRLRSKW